MSGARVLVALTHDGHARPQHEGHRHAQPFTVTSTGNGTGSGLASGLGASAAMGGRVEAAGRIGNARTGDQTRSKEPGARS